MKFSHFLLLAAPAAFAADAPKPKAKPEFQYQTEGIQIRIPTADEPRVTQFGQESVKAAAKYLEEGAISWVREKSCVNCHTTGPYLTERPALIPLLGKANEEIVADFIEFVPKEIKEVNETATKSGHKHYPAAFTSVWRSLGLAEWDKHVTRQTSEHTEKSLRDMFERQSASGAFVSHGEVEIPHITTDFELSLQAARAITAAPGWFSGLKDEKLIAKVEKLKAWLKQPELKNDFDRVLRLQLAVYLPELVSSAERESALALLASRQHADGGWSTRDFSALNDWHFEISDAERRLHDRSCHRTDAANQRAGER
jgi:squalene-hopene/tetraprenyl-beta-curcumene cyclase